MKTSFGKESSPQPIDDMRGHTQRIPPPPKGLKRTPRSVSDVLARQIKLQKVWEFHCGPPVFFDPVVLGQMKGKMILGVDSPFFSTIVLFKNRICFPRVLGGFVERRKPGSWAALRSPAKSLTFRGLHGNPTTKPTKKLKG